MTIISVTEVLNKYENVIFMLHYKQWLKTIGDLELPYKFKTKLF